MRKEKNSHSHWDVIFSSLINLNKPNASYGEGDSTPLQYSCLENLMDGGAWWAAVHGVAKSQTWLSDFTFTFHFHALEKEMATHPSVLAWRIPGTGEPGGLPSMGSHKVEHDWSNLAAAAVHVKCGFSQATSQLLWFLYFLSCLAKCFVPSDQSIILRMNEWLHWLLISCPYSLKYSAAWSG